MELRRYTAATEASYASFMQMGIINAYCYLNQLN